MFLQPVEESPDDDGDKSQRQTSDQVKLEWGEISIGIWAWVLGVAITRRLEDCGTHEGLSFNVLVS